MAEIQARRGSWKPAVGVLGELVAAAHARAAELVRSGGEADTLQAGFPAPGAFVSALRRPSVGVIAEIKRRSPSKGSLNEALEAGPRAAEYELGGAAAISVLTEPARFGGSLADLTDVRKAVRIPPLRKDFIVHVSQLSEARSAGACAVLLIARALEPSLGAELAAAAGALGLDVLFEVRDEAELERAIAIRACAIGINTRDLETLKVDPAVGERLLRLVPPDRVAVYESGVITRADVERAAAWGADAVLVGSSLSRVRNGAAAVRELSGVPTVRRG